MNSGWYPPEDNLPIWVIYQNPRDFPGRFVVRRQDVLPGGAVWNAPIACVCETLVEARNSVPPFRSLLTRHPDDDRVIVETWL